MSLKNEKRAKGKSRVFALKSNVDPGLIPTIALCRWLNVSQLEYLLCPDTTPLIVQENPPSNPPPSGSLILYNRKLTRNYKNDGYNWIRKRNSTKVREDHVKLRLNGKDRVAGCYVHCVDIPSMHRRAYHLLEPSSSTTKGGEDSSINSSTTNSSNSPKTWKTCPNFVLVHYLDTEIATKNAELHSQTSDTKPLPKNKRSGAKGGRSTRSSRINKESSHDSTTSKVNTKADLTSNHVSSHPLESLGNNNTDTTPTDHDLDVETLDLLWDMVVDESSDVEGAESMNILQSDLSTMFSQSQPTYQQPYQHIQTHSDFVHNDSNSNIKTAGEEGNPEARSKRNGSRDKTNSFSHEHHDSFVESFNSKRSSSTEENMNPEIARSNPLPDIVDFSPESIIIDQRVMDSKSKKLVLSVSEPISEPLKDFNSQSKFYTIVAFVNTEGFIRNVTIPNSKNIQDDVCLSILTRLNPYSFKCMCPSIIVKSSCARSLVIIEALVPLSLSPCGSEVSLAVKSLLLCSIIGRRDVNLPKLYESEHTVFPQHQNISMKFLSQISEEQFAIQVNNMPSFDINPESATSARPTHHHALSLSDDLPAPPTAMAMVASALKDYPRQPLATAVIESTLNNSNNDSEMTNAGHRTTEVKEHSIPKSNDGISLRRKRTASYSFNPQPNNLVGGSQHVQAAASMLMNSTSLESKDETVGDEVDRHCKIRFVEKLTSVITETKDGKVCELKDDLNNNDVEMGEKSKISMDKFAIDDIPYIDDSQLQSMEDDELDSLLDNLLIRIVENLIEMSSSVTELQEELDSRDKSGFALIHYASLYNLLSLIPLLLSRGASANITTVIGKLTPLHLACGAGNEAIVNLLVRSGCNILIQDDFGRTPADHATMNGFPNIAQFLDDESSRKMSLDVPEAQNNSTHEAKTTLYKNSRKDAKESFQMQCTSPDHADLESQPSSSGSPEFERETKHILLQTAFSSLSLKDKLTLNMLIKKKKKNRMNNRNGKKLSGKASDVIKNMISEGFNTDHLDTKSVDNYEEENNKIDYDGSDLDSDDEHSCISSCISDGDRENLDVAMRLMNKEELEELQTHSSETDLDVRTWMLQRNYESLKNASRYIQSSLKTIAKDSGSKLQATLVGVAEEKNIDTSASKGSSKRVQFDEKQSKGDTKRKMGTLLDQAIANFIIRKAMLESNNNRRVISKGLEEKQRSSSS